jgi:uncharacterized membrane protein YfhO
MAQIQNIFIDQGTTFSLSLSVSDQNGDLKDLTGYTAAAQMRRSYYTTTSTNFTAVVSLPEDGEVTISLTAVQTSAIKAGRYVYDIEITGDEETLRVLEGIVIINPEVTK